mmetsp:Transcript_45759/g.103103  ORF Transcript_45759/g.103103 Transcript_45759/m.103103 type:complete len:132 (-) Transcript_45759:444-839(-)
MQREGDRMLPYTRWLDYCKVAFFVPERVATTNMRAVLEQLQAVAHADVESKQIELRRVWDAFVFRGSQTAQATQAPSAADYVLGEACAAARRFSATVEAPPATRLRRQISPCTIRADVPARQQMAAMPALL